MTGVSFRKILAVVFIFVAFAWIWLFFSEQGILIDSEVLPGTPAPTLECTYFTGTGFFTEEITETESVTGLECAGMSDIK